MHSKEVTIKNHIGLHARPATYFIQEANKYKCNVFVEKDGRQANAKSLLGVLSLGITGGKKVKLIADGPDEDDCVESLSQMINNGFEEKNN